MAFRLESALEAAIRELAVRRGWYEIKIEKCSRKGFPDRFLARNGVVMLLEAKKPGELDDLSRNQKKEHRDLIAHGVPVHTVDSLEAARELLY